VKRGFLLLLFLSLSMLCSAADLGGVEFSIRFYEKRIYYLEDRDHPVQIEAVIANNSPETFRFKMAGNRVFNFDFELATPTNLLADHAKEFIIARQVNQPVLFREISLEPGEKYALVVALTDFTAVDKPGSYSLRGQFYPELNLSAASPVMKSNTLSLNLRPAVLFPEERALIEAETGVLLSRESLPPDEVVTYALHARQQSQWEKFFLYLDLESLYLKKPERARSYQRLAEEGRRAALEQFKKELKLEKVDQDILVIPSSFEILKTTYTPTEAEVLVKARFKYRDYTELKRYTFALTRKDRIWLISDYEIENLGTE